VNVFGIDPKLDRFDIANQAIEATYQFFASIGIPMHLREVGIDESRIDKMAHHVAENEGLESAWAPLTEKDIADIFRASL
jgi:alcohol dehydrogenase YqhD (iron-dependent ADH family)